MRKVAFPILFFLFLISNLHAESQFERMMNGQDSTNYDSVKVEEVLSADTIMLAGGEKIKLIGLNAPSIPKRERIVRDENNIPIKEPINPTDTIEQKSYRFVERLLTGKTVRLEFDEQKKSDDFKTLAYIFLKDGTFVNVEILRQGYAQFQLQPLNHKYKKELEAAYQEASREQRGFMSR